MHDEFAQLLVEGLPMDNELGTLRHEDNDLEVRTEDSEPIKLYKVYRRKLQGFLSMSQDYHPQRVLKVLPRSYLHENALVLSRLGRHREVLKIYLQQLRNQELAETYCGRIYSIMTGEAGGDGVDAAKGGNKSSRLQSSKLSFSSSVPVPTQQSIPLNLHAPGEIYLLLFEVILDENDEAEVTSPHTEKFDLVVALAEKYYDRFDVNAFLELMPRNTPISVLLKYFQIVYEFQSSRRRNLQVVHQILRTREVYLRTVGAKEVATAAAAAMGKKK